MDSSHLAMMTLAGIALAWVSLPENWPGFHADIAANAPESPVGLLTREMAAETAKHLAEHLIAAETILIREAN